MTLRLVQLHHSRYCHCASYISLNFELVNLVPVQCSDLRYVVHEHTTWGAIPSPPSPVLLEHIQLYLLAEFLVAAEFISHPLLFMAPVLLLPLQESKRSGLQTQLVLWEWRKEKTQTRLISTVLKSSRYN
jgi:hypothetical protein